MSRNLGRWLQANFWESANPQLARGLRPTNLPYFFEPTVLNEALCKIAGKHGLKRISPASPKKSIRVTRRFASGGFFVLGFSPSSAAVDSGAACAETLRLHRDCGLVNRKSLHFLTRNAWIRSIHTTKDDRLPSEVQKEPSNPENATISHPEPEKKGENNDHRNPETQAPMSKVHVHSISNRNLIDRLPHIPHLHRPSKEELLAAANGFWSRLKVRFKWFSIRSVRPFNLDEITALFSWVLLGHVVWVVLGTTTFFSLLILAINTVFAQETLAGWIGNYLTKSSGVKVVFESAIVPKWRDGVITFKNVFVSRRPGQGTGNVSKGSSKTAAAAAAAAASSESSNLETANQRPVAGEGEDTNYTQFDLSIDTVNVTLSFTKWFNGKGLLRDVEVKGIRGVVDRRHVYWPDVDLDPKSYRHEHKPGDFEIDSFKMEDLLVTIYQPGNFRPFPVSIFSCDLPQLRQQWLFYDFLSANMMSGSFDNSLFTIHPRQSHNYTGLALNQRSEPGEPQPWKKHSRIRIDGLNIDHLNRGIQGPFSWIHEGNVDIIADIMFPADNGESLAKVMADFYDRLEATVTTNQYPVPMSKNADRTEEDNSTERKQFLDMDLRIHLNNVRAVVPIFTRDLSYINNALIRPIVAYINSRRTFIPINCRLIKDVKDFDGSWTIYDSALMDDLSAAVYDAFAQDVVDDQARKRRFKKVGFWSLQLAAQAIFLGMAGNIA
ncbi:hypothetical protein ASPZODRAFT_114092 [Penicilliopsis zonata CBS 506.65]|uniref:Mitochondrial distribution and morphology protein family 31/32 n=1 Tax=Penicilliopsis zonata CBS 506.65 TaxID=1073090 RepID=A0A1L9SJN2_9EURO|nr:hypothetical protein ASPZODRAFT_114092 [Penicilliopsis zonata CBS 506.65]OJJ47430.1 hypothetical protein ASPZODRAFT_114092 [Penicilliopsis zonata CBS 506.65]